jgi:hypothetical protein
MAITAKINVTTGIGRATITQPNKSTIVAQNFTPKPNVSLSQLNDVTISGVENGQVLVYNSASGKYEANTITASVTVVNGGSF